MYIPSQSKTIKYIHRDGNGSAKSMIIRYEEVIAIAHTNLKLK